ncbi:uncharacterized [Tachysurus ichikawai]
MSNTATVSVTALCFPAALNTTAFSFQSKLSPGAQSRAITSSFKELSNNRTQERQPAVGLLRTPQPEIVLCELAQTSPAEQSRSELQLKSGLLAKRRFAARAGGCVSSVRISS